MKKKDQYLSIGIAAKRCGLYNADDEASSLGSGPQYLLGNKPGNP